MKRKKRIDEALRNLATIQMMFERYFRLNGNRDVEAFGIEVDCMLDVVKAVGGHSAEKDFPDIVKSVRDGVQDDKG